MNTGDAHRHREPQAASIARIDATGWGLFFVWIAGAMAGGVGWGLAILGTGLISLGVQLVRRISGLPVDRWGVGFGSCLSLAGLAQWLDIPLGSSPLAAWVVPVALAAIGVAILVSVWLRRR